MSAPVNSLRRRSEKEFSCGNKSYVTAIVKDTGMSGMSSGTATGERVGAAVGGTTGLAVGEIDGLEVGI